MPDFWPLASAVWADIWAQRDDPLLGPLLKGIAVAFALGLVVMVLSARAVASSSSRGKVKEDADKDLPKVGRPFLWGLFSRHQHPVKVGSFAKRIVFDVAWRHIGIIGTTGSRKSTLMALLFEAIGKTFSWTSGDHSPPLINLTLSKLGKVWRPRGELGWYPWGGELELAVQRVEHLFDAVAGDGGVHRSMFKQAARLAWADTQEAFEKYLKRVPTEERRSMLRELLPVRVGPRARKVEQILEVLPAVATGASSKLMVENWGARLVELLDSLGGSLQTAEEGGFDLVEELAAGIPVGYALNSFADVANRSAFAKMAILEQLRAADVLGNLTIGLDEIGLIGAELFAEAVRTLRVRLCTGVFASHISADFAKLLKGLINVWFLGQVPGSDEVTREWEEETTFHTVKAKAFGEHALPQGAFWLAANGRVQRVQVDTWKTRPIPPPLPDIMSEPVVAPAPAPAAPSPSTRFPRSVATTHQNEPENWSPSSFRVGTPVSADARRVSFVSGKDGSGDVEARTARVVRPGVPNWIEAFIGQAKLGKADAKQLRFIATYYEERNGHQLSKYRLTTRGRPQCKFMGQTWYPYALLKAIYDELDLDEVKEVMNDRGPMSVTCSHECRERDPSLSADEEHRCQNVEDLIWRYRGDHAVVEWQRRRAKLLRAVQ